MNDRGTFVFLFRKIRKHRLWPDPDKRPFTPLEAWIDLILSASFESRTYSVIVSGSERTVHLYRGESARSYRFLAKRWGWGRHKVENFIRVGKKCGEMGTRIEQGVTVISLLKYDYYQTPYMREDVPMGDSKGTVAGQSGDADGTKERKRRNEGEMRKKIDIVFSLWQEHGFIKHRKLYDSHERRVKAAINQYGLEMVCHALKVYSAVQSDPDTWWDYKWTLEEFSLRGVKRFGDLTIQEALENYRSKQSRAAEARRPSRPEEFAGGEVEL